MKIERVRTHASDRGSLVIARCGKPWLYLDLLPYYPLWAAAKLWRESRIGRQLEAWGRRHWP